MSMSDPVRFAIIGCGRMGRHHGRLLAADSRARIVALFDPVTSAADSLAREVAPNAVAVHHIDDLWQHNEIDAVVLCTPTHEHFLQATTALDCGWHVLCEKPLAATAAEIRQLIARSQSARERGQRLSVGYQRRHWATFRTLRREVQSGRWGPVTAVNVHAVECWQATIAGTWRDDPQQNPGGFLGDAGSHKLDMLFYVTELSPREVFARSWKRGSHVESVTSVSAICDNDVLVTLNFIGDGQHLGEDWHIHCAGADLTLNTDRMTISRGNHSEPLATTEPQSEPVRSFLDVICDGAEELAPADCAWPVFQFTQAILQSAREGRTVRIN